MPQRTSDIKDTVGRYNMFNWKLRIWGNMGLSWWFSGKESTCQCRKRGLNPWSWKIPHASEQLSRCATTIEPVIYRKAHAATKTQHRITDNEEINGWHFFRSAGRQSTDSVYQQTVTKNTEKSLQRHIMVKAKYSTTKRKSLTHLHLDPTTRKQEVQEIEAHVKLPWGCNDPNLDCGKFSY